MSPRAEVLEDNEPSEFTKLEMIDPKITTGVGARRPDAGCS
jgi:hypothetical protein